MEKFLSSQYDHNVPWNAFVRRKSELQQLKVRCTLKSQSKSINNCIASSIYWKVLQVEWIRLVLVVGGGFFFCAHQIEYQVFLRIRICMNYNSPFIRAERLKCSDERTASNFSASIFAKKWIFKVKVPYLGRYIFLVMNLSCFLDSRNSPFTITNMN